MGRLAVEFHPEAVAEARAAFEWYRDRSPQAAAAFMAELETAIECISEAPDRWPVFGSETWRFLFRRFPFLVVYRKGAEKIQVIAVAHGRRRPGYWKAR